MARRRFGLACAAYFPVFEVDSATAKGRRRFTATPLQNAEVLAIASGPRRVPFWAGPGSRGNSSDSAWAGHIIGPIFGQLEATKVPWQPTVASTCSVACVGRPAAPRWCPNTPTRPACGGPAELHEPADERAPGRAPAIRKQAARKHWPARPAGWRRYRVHEFGRGPAGGRAGLPDPVCRPTSLTSAPSAADLVHPPRLSQHCPGSDASRMQSEPNG